MALSLGYSPWLLGLSLLIAGGLSFWSYRTTIPALPPGRRWLLGALRFASLALICFLLLEPVVRHFDRSEQPPVLAVLVDDSESMRIVRGPAPDTSAQQVRDHLRPLLTPLGEDLSADPRFFGFDGSLRALPDAPLDTLRFDGGRTNIGDALEAVVDELQGENLEGIALVSDGQYNTGPNPARVADRSSVAIHTITVGDTSRRRDLQVRRVATNDLSYVDSEVPVQATIGTEDLGGRRTTVSLLEDGRVLDDVDVTLPDGTAELPVDLSFRPETAGLKQVTVRASPVEDEAATENNSRSVSLRVLDSKRSVLLLGAAPSPTYAAVRRVLERDANTTVTSRVPHSNGVFYEGPLPDSLSQFDVVVSVGFPSSAVPEEAVRSVATLLEDGMPALFLLDHQADLSAWREHFDGILPALPESSSFTVTEGSFTPVETARNHSVFQIEGGDLSLFDELPPLAVPTDAWTPTPDADVLAQARRPSLSSSSPLLVVRRRAGQRTAALLGTNTWRWATLPSSLSGADPLWPGLVSNLLRWVGTQNDERRVRIRPDTSPFDGDEPVEFTGQVYDESMNPVSNATVSVTITDSAGTEFPHSMDPLGNGRYGLNVGTLPEGTYRFEATARQEDATLGTDRGQFSVGALRLEYRQTRANPVLMRQIATRSGGTAYTTDDATTLSTDLASSSSFTSTTVTETIESELRRTSLFLLLIVGLLATEWTLRKRFGLT